MIMILTSSHSRRQHQVYCGFKEFNGHKIYENRGLSGTGKIRFMFTTSSSNHRGRKDGGRTQRCM